MSHCGKCSRFSVPSSKENVDRISALPDELLGYMLSFLPTKCAVSTSVLSPRWKCLHMLTNCLYFNAESCYCEDEKAELERKKCFKKFVNRVLLFHKVSPIKSFHLLCNNFIYDDSHLHNWINVAILKGVQQLHLGFRGRLNSLKPLPLCLFTSHTIVDLKIHSPILSLIVPDSAHLPSLKILNLKSIHFSNSHSFAALLSACPLLQALIIESCGWSTLSECHIRLSLGELKRLTINNCDGKLEVDAPNLIDLEVLCIYRMHLAFSLKNADSLAKAYLNFGSSYSSASFDSFDNDSSATFDQLTAELIKAVYHVKELHVLGHVMQHLGRTQEDHMPSYPNLRKITLGRCSYASWKYIAHWLGHSPRLETLHFDKGFVIDGPCSREEEWPSNVALVPFSSSRLKVVEAVSFRGYAAELALVKYLLKNASLLRRVVLRQETYNMNRKQERQVNRKLLMFPRASKTCVVRVRGY
ncbi:hypothetical protein vseg_016419 [Gypsophila vaccaria]